MKLSIKFFLIIAVATLFTYHLQSCDGKKDHKKEDTRQEKTWVHYIHNPIPNDVRTAKAIRTIVDTFKMVLVDSSNGKRIEEAKWTKDTFYAVQIWDSLRDNTTKKVILDSTGKPKQVGWYWPELDKWRFLQDYNKTW